MIPGLFPPNLHQTSTCSSLVKTVWHGSSSSRVRYIAILDSASCLHRTKGRMGIRKGWQCVPHEVLHSIQNRPLSVSGALLMLMLCLTWDKKNTLCKAACHHVLESPVRWRHAGPAAGAQGCQAGRAPRDPCTGDEEWGPQGPAPGSQGKSSLHHWPVNQWTGRAWATRNDAKLRPGRYFGDFSTLLFQICLLYVLLFYFSTEKELCGII